MTEAELLAAVYDNPDDDAPRTVYADWLQEQGDPRGELIALQLSTTDDKKEKQKREKRERRLIRKHMNALLGPLAPIVKTGEHDVEFRRGFLARCEARFANQQDVEMYGHLPAWRTVEELGYDSSLDAPKDQEEWAHFMGPTMRNVRRVTYPSVRFLLEHGPWRIERLMLSQYKSSVEEFRALLASDAVPHLDSVCLGSSDDAWLDLPRYPREIEFFVSLEYHSARYIRRAQTTPLAVLSFFDTHASYSLTRDDSGVLSRLEIKVTMGSQIEHKSSWVLRDLGEKAVRALRDKGLPLTQVTGRIEVDWGEWESMPGKPLI